MLISNASMFHRDAVRKALEVLDANNGEIWAKLDAGTEAYYREVARSAVPFQRILDNLAMAARVRPIVIQSLFMRIREQSPSAAEQAAYCDRLAEITAAGGQIKLVQIHTVARAGRDLGGLAFPPGSRRSGGVGPSPHGAIGGRLLRVGKLTARRPTAGCPNADSALHYWCRRT